MAVLVQILREIDSELLSSNIKGCVLAFVSSAFIGVGFIIKKKGIKRAGAPGAQAGELYIIVQKHDIMSWLMSTQ
jgi:hypothetical protein